ncbi:MAG: EamA family transporter [Alphaproteobacteria bacterium]|nr:EamA family transporter [Alphaproteobacteria bacterium]
MTMPWEAVAAALAAAVMHATWNASLRAGNDRLLDATLLFAVAGTIGLVVALIAGPIDPAAWLWIGVTAVLHLPYVYFLARAYERGELSHVYTIARGLPPLMVAGLAVVAVGEIPTPAALAGIALISIGILTVGMSPGAHRQGTLLAAAVAVSIALYTISDGIGVRASGNALAYNGWVFFVVALATTAMALILRGNVIMTYAKQNWRRAVIGGALSFVSYGLVLWAMTFAPIAAVSAFRETSVVFAALIGIVFFAENAAPRRLAGAAIVALGAVVLKFG